MTLRRKRVQKGFAFIMKDLAIASKKIHYHPKDIKIILQNISAFQKKFKSYTAEQFRRHCTGTTKFALMLTMPASVRNGTCRWA